MSQNIAFEFLLLLRAQTVECQLHLLGLLRPKVRAHGLGELLLALGLLQTLLEGPLQLHIAFVLLLRLQSHNPHIVEELLRVLDVPLARSLPRLP